MRKVVTRRMIAERLCGRFDRYFVLLGDLLELGEEGGKASLLRIEDTPFVLDRAPRLLPAIASRLISRGLGATLGGSHFHVSRLQHTRRLRDVALIGRGLHFRWPPTRSMVNPCWRNDRRTDYRRNGYRLINDGLNEIFTHLRDRITHGSGDELLHFRLTGLLLGGCELFHERAKIERAEHQHRARRALARVTRVPRRRFD